MIPEKKQWKGIYPGNYTGNLWSTFNIDLEKTPGRIALSDKFRRIASGLGVVSKFIKTNATATEQWFAIVNDTDILRNGNSVITAGTWATDDTSGSPNDPRDMVLHESANGEQRLVCTRQSDIAILNSTGVANAWDADWGSTVLSLTLTNQIFHPIARLQRLLAIGDRTVASGLGVPVIHTIDSTDAISSNKLTFHADFNVRLAITNSDRFWFGLENDSEGPAKIIEWDGFSSTYNKEHDLEGSIPLTGFVVDDIPYFITEKGYIFRWTGGGFVRQQSFNMDEQRMIFGPTIFQENTISSYGTFVDGNIVYINIGAPLRNASGGSTALTGGSRKARSGVWIYNTLNNNLYHHMAIGQHASAGTDVDYGHGLINFPGAVVKAKVGDDRILVASASVYTGGATWLTTPANGIYRMIRGDSFASDEGRNRGYFITPYIPIKEVEAMWEALWVKFRRFRITAGDTTSDDRIVVKWRVVDPLFEADAQDPAANPNPMFNAEGTWVNTTSFTCKVPIGVTVGDEVEVLTGDNAGCSFNISTLSATPDNSTAITVTIDEAAPTSSTDTFLCRFDNWNTETAISSTTVGNQKVPFTSIGHGEFIQLKIELRGHATELDELIPVLKDLTKVEHG